MKRAAPAVKAAPAGRRTAAAAEKNRPLVDDIRLLGRILGDVIREQEGAAAFELIERVRQLSVAYRLKRDKRAGAALDRLLKNLSGDQTVSVIRAFSYFSHLANIAEDRHHVRRREHHERQGHRHVVGDALLQAELAGLKAEPVLEDERAADRRRGGQRDQERDGTRPGERAGGGRTRPAGLRDRGPGGGLP